VQSVAALAANSALRLRIVFSLREDYLAELDEFRDDVTDLFANDYRLRPLTAFGARQAITQPLIIANIQYDRRLLVRLVDLLAEVGFDPLMLQILCTEVYRLAMARRDTDGRLTEDDLEKAGGLDGVVRRYLDRVIAAIPPNTVLLSRTVLDTLITQEKTKRAVTLDAFVNADFSASEAELSQVLGVFERQRLLRAERRGSQTWYELGHERLVNPVLDWLKLDENFFNFRVARDLIANSCSGEVWRTNFETLLGEGALKHLVARYEKRLRVAPLEIEFVFRSAVYRQTDGSHWASLLGADRCRAILLEFLASSNEQARIGAARAATQFEDPGGALAEACLHTALTDASTAARRAAGCALAKLATNEHLTRLFAELRVRATRGAALEVIADLRQAGRSLQSFGRLWRLRARIIANKRKRVEHRDAIAEQGKRGAVVGLVAGVFWALSVAAAGGFGLAWISGADALATVGFAMLFLIPAALGIGALMGWRIGRAGALDAAYRGNTRWAWTVLRLRLVYTTLGVVFAIDLVWSVIARAFGEEFVIFLNLLVAGILVQLAVAAVTKLARPAVWPNVRAPHRWGWTLVASGGGPVLVVMVGVWLIALFGRDTAELLPAAITAGAFVSVWSAVAIATLARTPIPKDIQAPSASERRHSRARLTVLAAAVVAWFLVIYGVDSLPFIPRPGRSVQIAPGTTVTIGAPLRPHLTDSAYFTVTAPESSTPTWVRVISPPVSAEATLSGFTLSQGNVVYLPPGNHRLVITGETTPDSASLQLEAAEEASSVDGLAPGVQRLVLIRFDRVKGTAEWQGVVRGMATGVPDARVTVSRLNNPETQDRALVEGTIGVSGEKSTDVDLPIGDAPPARFYGAATEWTTAPAADRPWELTLTLTFDKKDATATPGTGSSEAGGTTPKPPDSLLIPFEIAVLTPSR
jgi:hypothetical protein